MMNDAYVNVNNVPTKVMTWGKWIEEDFEGDERKEIVILVPGNPGITDFYKDFLQTIYDKVNIPVWAIGHAGHEPPKDNNQLYDMPVLNNNKDIYGLDGQVKHKIEFIEKYVPKDVKIHFIGHSIGSYIILQLLEVPSIKERVVKSYLLFPTIEYMAETPNGKLLVNFVKHILKLVLFLAWIFMILPTFIQNILLYIYSAIRNVEDKHKETIRNIVNPDVLDKVFFMAFDEMDLVRERNQNSIVENVKKIKFYYGATDGWTPIKYYEKLKKDVPDVEAELCVRNFNHAFVLGMSVPVGQMVSNWILE